MVCSNINADGTTDPRYRWRAQAAVVTTTAPPDTVAPTSTADTTPITTAPVTTPRTNATPAAGMPNTGIDTGKWAVEAALLVGMGTTLVFSVRRRRWPLR